MKIRSPQVMGKDKILAGRKALRRCGTNAKVLHETCVQYVARRLSEGWAIVWQGSYHLILSSPDGNTLRPVDLWNDVETLRPNAAGDECNIRYKIGVACPNQYQNVDEEVADDYGSCNFEMGVEVDWFRNLYNIEAPEEAEATINFVKVYAICNAESPQRTNLKICIKTGGFAHESDEIQASGGWNIYSKQWDNNPQALRAWSWADIGTLQIGESLRGPDPEDAERRVFCTQVYVEVDYGVGLENKSANMAAKMVAAGLI